MIDFLVRAITPAGTPPDFQGIDWRALWNKARDHCIAPYLHQRWLDLPALHPLPQHFVERLAHARVRNSERNRRLTDALEELNGSLERAGIQVLVSKGPPVAQEFYPDPGLRVMYDLDLIVHAHDRSRAASALLALGYRRYFPNRASGGNGELLWRPQPYRWDPESVFDPDQPLFVELHTLPWTPGWHGFGFECRLDLWEDHRELCVSGIRLRVPSAEKLLVHLAVHYALNVLESSARLMHLLDIVLLLELRADELDWERVWTELDKSRVAALCSIPFVLSERVRGRAIPEPVRSRVRAATPGSIRQWLSSRALRDMARVNVHNRDYALIYFLHWHAAVSWREKLRVLAYSCRAPFSEAHGGLSGSRLLLHRMLHRARNLARIGEVGKAQ